MKISIIREELVKAVSTTSRLATTRTTLPILQNLLFKVEGNILEIRATDLEQTIIVKIEGTDAEEGAITVPAKLLAEYLQSNTDNQISLALKEPSTLEIKSKHSSAKIRGLSPEEYPTLPTTKADTSIVLDAAQLEKAVKAILFASSNDDTRPILTGLLFRFKDNNLTIVGTDGYRLAMSSLPIQTEYTGDLIIPKRSMSEILKLAESGEIVFNISAQQLRVVSGNTTFVARTLEGAFPAFEGKIPTKSNIKVNCVISSLSQALRAASTFSRDSAFSTKLELSGKLMKITAVSPVLGEASSEIELETEVTSPLTISLNAQYLLEPLQVITGEVELSFIDQNSPILLRTPTLPNYLYLLMPLRSE